MAGSTPDARPAPSPARGGRLATRVGAGMVVAAVPLAAVTGALLVAGAPTLAAGVEAAARAATGPLTGRGLAWLFHVGVLGALCGTWLVGLGLVLDGLSA